METLTADPNRVVCGLKQLISIYQWRDCNFNSDSLRTKLENANDVISWQVICLVLPPGNIWHRRWECCRIRAHALLLIILHICVIFFFWNMLIIWLMDLWVFFVFVYFGFLPEVVLNPCKVGNPFNYCQDLVVRCNIPFLSSSCMAAHGDSAPTLATAKTCLLPVATSLCVTTF